MQVPAIAKRIVIIAVLCGLIASATYAVSICLMGYSDQKALYAIEDAHKNNRYSVLAEYASHNNAKMRSAAMSYLAESNDKKYITVYVNCLNDPNRMIRMNALGHLAKLGGEDALPHLVRCLECDDDRSVRVGALYHIGIIMGEDFNLPSREVPTPDDLKRIREWIQSKKGDGPDRK